MCSELLSNGLWSASDRGDVARVRELLAEGKDVNARNCLGCTPLLYACGSGHTDTVRLLLSHPDVDVNRRNNDRLTSFMLAMQGGSALILGGGSEPPAWHGWTADQSNAQEKMKRLMDLPATNDLEWARHDRWTALMEACNFGHRSVVELLLEAPGLDLEAVNLRGQTADQVASSRGHEGLADLIKQARQDAENPEELPRIRELEKEVASLKQTTRQRLLDNLELHTSQLAELKRAHEREMEPLSRKIDLLQTQLDEAKRQRMAMITRHVREVKAREDQVRQVRVKLHNFERFAGYDIETDASSSTSHQRPQSASSTPDLSIFEKDFECSVCLEDMRPPTKIFQCRNGHVMCEHCQGHPEVEQRCPSCRIPLANGNLMRNIPMEKLAMSFYERSSSRRRKKQQHLRGSSRRGSSVTRESESADRKDLEEFF